MNKEDDLDAKLIEVAKQLAEYLYLVKKMEKQAALQYVEHMFEVRDSCIAHDSLQSGTARPDQVTEPDNSIEEAVYNEIRRRNKPQLGTPKTNADLLVLEQRLRKYFDGKILRLFHNMFMAESVMDVNIQLSMLESYNAKQQQVFTAINNAVQAGLWPRLSHV